MCACVRTHVVCVYAQSARSIDVYASVRMCVHVGVPLCPRVTVCVCVWQRVLSPAWGKCLAPQGLACCFGICAISHLEDTLAQLEDFVRSEVFRKSIGILNIFKVRLTPCRAGDSCLSTSLRLGGALQAGVGQEAGCVPGAIFAPAFLPWVGPVHGHSQWGGRQNGLPEANVAVARAASLPGVGDERGLRPGQASAP